WRAEGRGRIGLWAVPETWILPLHGRADLHGELWSEAVATLARVHANPLPRVDAGARVGERFTICGLPDAVVIESPDGGRVQPIVDPATGERRCAGFWPQAAGWHVLRVGEAMRPFHIAADEEDSARRLAELREATLQLASAPPPSTATTAVPPTASGRSWPWFLAWLLLAALAWWFERSRLGLRVVGRT
ncbi:MAG TPA: carboxypeptidase regulatory-like domain-containing protein, partial [Luteimonas sp.]|nr:carboxypeptidase regulatory-like domain-containing protein [Luteimonas sp.]